MNLLNQNEDSHLGLVEKILEYAKRESGIFPTDTPQPMELIYAGICTNCDHLGKCVWQHNNNINCQHYK